MHAKPRRERIHGRGAVGKAAVVGVKDRSSGPAVQLEDRLRGPIGSVAAGAAFKDTWTLSDIDAEWINLLKDRQPTLWRVP